MDEINTNYSSYQRGSLSPEKFKNCLLEQLFLNREQTGLSKIDDDCFSDFLIHFASRIDSILEKYDSEVSDFTNYFFGVIRVTFSWWYRKYKKRINEKYYIHAVGGEDIGEREYEYKCCEKYNEVEMNEKSLSIDDLKKITEVKIGASYKDVLKHKRISTISKENLEILRNEACLILALKSCWFIDDEMIEKLSVITGIACEEILALVYRAKLTMKRKIMKIQELERRRNSEYFLKKKCELSAEGRRNFFWNVYFLEERSKLHEKKWNQLLNRIKSCNLKMVPSNNAVATILGIDCRRVSYIVKVTRKYLDNLKLLCETSDVKDY